MADRIDLERRDWTRLAKQFHHLYKLPLAVIRFINKHGLRTFWRELKKLLITPVAVSTDGLPDPYQTLMRRHIRGRGIAFGIGREHLTFLPNITVDYVGDPCESDASKRKSEKADDGYYDFIISDQRFNPSKSCMKAISSWVPALKPGGIICFVFRELDDALDQEMGQSKLFKKALGYIKERKISSHLLDKYNKAKIIAYFQAQGLKIKILDFTIYMKNGIKECVYLIEVTDNVTKVIKALEKKIADKRDNQYLIDVIVPIYNAYEDLEKCLYSLIIHQDIYRIILIDDCSTDTRVKELIHTLKNYNGEGFIVVENGQNIGYLKTANKGMRMTDSDVILLNSDTMVTSGWARKMRDCAYSDSRIATVTPFTNNGATCSIFKLFKSNDIPEGFTLDSFAECVERSSNRKYPELPAAVGFCLFIKRNVINDIGFFDEVKFEKGYGEEDEFSLRAMQKGYKSVLCDDTFIFHKGCASFLNERGDFILKNHEVLARMYPGYFPAIEEFKRLNPLKEIHENIRLEIGANHSSYERHNQ